MILARSGKHPGEVLLKNHLGMALSACEKRRWVANHQAGVLVCGSAERKEYGYSQSAGI